MAWLFTKYFLTAAVVVLVSELAAEPSRAVGRRRPRRPERERLLALAAGL